MATFAACTASKWMLPMALLLLSSAPKSIAQEEEQCEEPLPSPLTPSDLPPIQVYSDWTETKTVQLSSNSDDGDDKASTTELTVSIGQIQQMGYDANDGDDEDGSQFYSEFDLVQNLATRDEVNAIRALLHSQVQLDNDPDTVDGFPTQEIFVDTTELRKGGTSKDGAESDELAKEREELREALRNITDPILNDRLTPYVRQRYPNVCANNKDPTRRCTPCYSLIRRYQQGQRQTHAPHRDGHAIVTAVISLSDYDDDYTGGLYVASAQNQPSYLGLRKGDAAVHQSDLLHGVKVHPPTPLDGDDNDNEPPRRAERWSWILWFRDSTECEDHSHEWFQECAASGNPTCEYLQATKSSSTSDVVKWNTRAAEHGHATAAVKLGRAYLGKLGGNAVALNQTKARQLFEAAIRSSNDADAHYGIASMLLEEHKAFALGQKEQPDEALPEVRDRESMLKTVVKHLEASAYGGHPFAMFNLGIAHLFGYHPENGAERDVDLAGEWFQASMLPEGFAARAMHYDASGEKEKAEEFRRQAQSLGFGSEMRIQARKHTGYGGASGIELNLPWPPNRGGQVPPEW